VRRFVRVYQHEHVVLVRLDVVARALDARAHRGGARAVRRHRWWTRRRCALREQFFPGSLPTLLGPFLAGGTVDEPFELWN
jgi:hypothetical protein